MAVLLVHVELMRCTWTAEESCASTASALQLNFMKVHDSMLTVTLSSPKATTCRALPATPAPSNARPVTRTHQPTHPRFGLTRYEKGTQPNAKAAQTTQGDGDGSGCGGRGVGHEEREKARLVRLGTATSEQRRKVRVGIAMDNEIALHDHRLPRTGPSKQCTWMLGKTDVGHGVCAAEHEHVGTSGCRHGKAHARTGRRQVAREHVGSVACHGTLLRARRRDRKPSGNGGSQPHKDKSASFDFFCLHGSRWSNRPISARHYAAENGRRAGRAMDW